MKTAIALLLLIAGATSCGSSESLFELDAQQSMLLTGKGPGQDGAINPYSGQKSIAVVNNLGNTTFHVRIQQQGEILEDSSVGPGTTREFILEPGHELYLDSEQKSKSKVTFRKYKE